MYHMGSHFFFPPKYYGYAHALTPVCIDAIFYVRMTLRLRTLSESGGISAA